MTTNLMSIVPEIPLNGIDKVYYSWEQFGYRALMRISFDLKGGAVDAELLRQAYAFEVKRWPILNAAIVEKTGPGWDLRWAPRGRIDAEQAVREFDFSMLDAQAAENKIKELQFDSFPGSNSRKDLSFFIYLCRLPDAGSRLLVFMHHALTDAHGIQVVLGGIFSTYNSLCAGMPPAAAQCNAAPPAPLLPVKRSRHLRNMLEMSFFFITRLITLRGQSPVKMMRGKSSFSGRTAAVMREISAEQFTLMRSSAKRHGARLDSLLAAAQITAVAGWKKEQGEPAGLINAEILAGLRTEEDTHQNLSNKFSPIIVDSTPAQRTTPAILLQHINKQLDRARERNFAGKLLSFLNLVNNRIGSKTVRLWGGLVCNNPRIGDSTMITNIGRVWAGPDNTTLITKLGDADITACYMAGPPMPSIGSYSGFLSFNNRLYYSFNYFDWAMTDADAHRFTELFEQALADLIACPALSAAPAEGHFQMTRATTLLTSP